MAGGMSLTMRAAKSNFFDRQSVLRAVDKGTARVLSKFGAFVRTRARSSIRKRKRVSAPGQPPSSHVGTLKRLIFFSFEPSKKSVVIGPTLFGGNKDVPKSLEYGGWSDGIKIRARPFMRPAFKAELQGKLAQQLKGVM